MNHHQCGSKSLIYIAFFIIENEVTIEIEWSLDKSLMLIEECKMESSAYECITLKVGRI